MRIERPGTFAFPAKFERDAESGTPVRVVDKELLRVEVGRYVHPLTMLAARQTVGEREKLPWFDPHESRYIEWDSEGKRRTVFGVASMFPQPYLVLSADDANLIAFNRHPEYATFVDVANRVSLVVLDLLTSLRPDLTAPYNQGAFGSLAGAVIRRGGAVWIIGAIVTKEFVREFEVLYRLLRRLGVLIPENESNGSGSVDGAGGGSDEHV